MSDLSDTLRSYDESLSQGVQPAGGWHVVWNDLQHAADEIDRLTAIQSASNHTKKRFGYGAWKRCGKPQQVMEGKIYCDMELGHEGPCHGESSEAYQSRNSSVSK